MLGVSLNKISPSTCINSESHLKKYNHNVALQPMIYVCVASAFNLPELESCLLRRPQYLVLIVSDFQAIKEGALLLAEQIQQLLPGIQIFRPDQELCISFDGRDVAHCLHWADTTLQPYLDTLPQLPRVCNITGGSKAITMALLNKKMQWQWLDYKADSKQELQRLTFEDGSVVAQHSEPLASARPEVVARLYSSSVIEKAENALVRAQPQATVTAAQNLWNALSCSEENAKHDALLSLFGNQTTGLESVWMYNMHATSKKQFSTMSSHEFIQQDEFTYEQLAWLQQWHALAPQALMFSLQSITLPSYRSKDDFKRWLSGDWLEQLAMHWLTDKVNAREMVANLKINPLPGEKSSLGERETDIVVHSAGRTTVIEVKTDFAPNGKIKDLLEQITSLGDRLGRTRKILLIGPQLLHKIEHDLDNIKKRCKADGVNLCYDKQTLLNLF